MRVAIREQLAALVVFSVLVSLAIVSIPTWIFVQQFVVRVEQDGLALTASLKAARISSELELVQTTCQTIATRILIQAAYHSFYGGNLTQQLKDDATADLQSALSSGGFSSLLQARLWPRNDTGPETTTGLLNVTGINIPPIRLPYRSPNGSEVFLGDPNHGYPPSLYPNLTYQVQQGQPDPGHPWEPFIIARPFPDVGLRQNGGLLLGPLVINATYAIISLTVPVREINNTDYVLGYLTVVASATTLLDIRDSREGLGDTGMTLIIGPDNPSNRFNRSSPASNATYVPPDPEAFGRQNVHFILPPKPVEGQEMRHSERLFSTGDYRKGFPMADYPVVLQDFSTRINTINNASADLSTKNEQGTRVAVGYARPQTTLVNWTVVVEQNEKEAYATIVTLRNILLGCVFGTAGLVLLLVFPCAHLSVLPIRRLKAATEKSIAPPGYADGMDDCDDRGSPGNGCPPSPKDEKGFVGTLKKIARRGTGRAGALGSGGGKGPPSEAEADTRRRVFKIPARVEDRKHFITDELTELTTTFNEMSDELLRQYTSLEEKVAERTRELEISKKAAEAANESKTLFIANISHELKTPLNGIMGMCAVCMEEDDITRIKQSLKTLYKSGDLLLHLLEDLLSFSKNQIGNQLSLEEKEFRLADIRLQILTIFEKQVREGKIDFSVNFVSSNTMDFSSSSGNEELEKKLPAIGPQGTGRLKDMCLWGDQHRILQVMINLVSNSLKFTPPGGKVEVRIRCVGEAEHVSDESRSSSFSNRASRTRHRVGSGSQHSVSSWGGSSQHYKNAGKAGTAIAINPMEPKPWPHVSANEQPHTPPPPNAKTYIYEFEVQDTGPGIPEEMQERVFEPFVQGDLGLTKKFGGTGLGLSICQQLAMMMGGSITLTSTVGVGTTFKMAIPLKYVKDRASSTASNSMNSRPPSVGSVDGENHRNSLVKSAAQESAAGPSLLDKQPRLVGLSQPFFAAAPTGPTPTSKEEQLAAIDRAVANKKGPGKIRVLVADDNSTNIEVVSRMLKLEDVYDVTIAKDGQEAYDMVKANMERNQRFDVIFMDIQMPNLDGLQSTRLIRKMGYSAPIVALTAFSEESNIKDCMESGMDEFLSKPIRRPALKQVLRKFATIPEEPETASLTKKSLTSEKTPTEVSMDASSAVDPLNADSDLDNDGLMDTPSRANGTTSVPGGSSSSGTAVAGPSSSPG